jgi:hypothetical protein
MFSKTPRIIISIILPVVVLVTGCSPAAEVTEQEPAATYTIPVSAAYPETAPELSIISSLPGMIRLVGCSDSEFVTGTIEISDKRWSPEIEKNDSKITLAQRVILKAVDTRDLTNLWKLRVSDNQPFRLEIQNARAEGHWNFSGLPITSLFAESGTTKNAFTFDEINPAVMQLCDIHCGDGDVIVEGILNAVCENMAVQAGTGSLTLRFGGKTLVKSLKVLIDAGTGVININIPPDVPAHVTIDGNSMVIPGSNITKLIGSGSTSIYQTESYQTTDGNTLEITISGGSGILYLNPPPS